MLRERYGDGPRAVVEEVEAAASEEGGKGEGVR